MKLSKKQAVKKLHNLMDRVQERNREIPDEEVEQDVREAITAVREEQRRDRHRSDTAK